MRQAYDTEVRLITSSRRNVGRANTTDACDVALNFSARAASYQLCLLTQSSRFCLTSKSHGSFDRLVPRCDRISPLTEFSLRVVPRGTIQPDLAESAIWRASLCGPQTRWSLCEGKIRTAITYTLPREKF